MCDAAAFTMPPEHAPTGTACRCCGAAALESLLDLGPLPVAGRPVAPQEPVALVPVHALVCAECRHVQLAGRAAPAEDGPEEEAERVVAVLAARLGLDSTTPVAEAAPRPGAASRAFARRGVPVAGAVPGTAAARRLRGAGDAPVLILARDALAAAEDPQDLAAAFRILLAPGGVLAIDLPDLLPLLRDLRFDAIGPHLAGWFRLATVEVLLAPHGLAVFDVAPPEDAAGRLRLFARHVEDRGKPVTMAVEERRALEAEAGLDRPETWRAFAGRVAAACAALRALLLDARQAGRRVIGHGASAEADRLLIHCGIGPDLLPVTVDPRGRGEGLVLPGSRIPLAPPAAVDAAPPDLVLVLDPPEAADAGQGLAALRARGARLLHPLPTPILS